MAIRAAGAVLWREDGDLVRVAIVHRPRHDDWSLPKGKLHGSESAAEAARREVREETGYGGVLGPALGEVRYEVPTHGGGQPKTVQYWAMEATTGRFVENQEVDRLRWLTPLEALDVLSYELDREVLRRFVARSGEGEAR